MGVVAPHVITLRSGRRLLVRSTRDEDAAALADLRRAVARDGAVTYAAPDELATTSDDAGELAARYAAAPGCLHIVAESEEHALAACIELVNGGYRRTAHAATFTLLVHPFWRRQGLGRALLDEMSNWASRSGVVETLHLSVLASNDAARALYERAGFTACGHLPRDVRLSTGEYVDTLMMFKHLGVAPTSED